MALYLIANGPMPTTAAPGTITTSGSVKTMLQIKSSDTRGVRIVEWGFSADGFAAAAPGKVELIETDVAATVTAHASTAIHKLDASALAGGDPTTNIIPVGTTATGYNASAEGTITASRLFDLQLIPPTGQYIKQFPLGREPVLQVSKFCRIRVTFAAAVSAYCYVVVEA